MIKRLRSLIYVLAISCMCACSFQDTRPQATLYDLGPLSTPTHVQALPTSPIISIKVHAPEWLETNLMSYRLDYINPQKVSFYTQSSWNMTPSQLLKDRFQSVVSRAGGSVSTVLTQDNQTILRLELEDFSQHFSSENNSQSSIIVRASLYQNGHLFAQKRFAQNVPATQPDAIGGALAMSKCADEIINDIIFWLYQK